MLVHDCSTPCLACAREACAQAGALPPAPACPDCGNPADREWHGASRCHGTFRAPPHVCEVYLLDGERIDLDDFVRENTDALLGDAALSPEQVAEILHLLPGETLHLGGGAGEIFALTRTR